MFGLHYIALHYIPCKLEVAEARHGVRFERQLKHLSKHKNMPSNDTK